METRDKRIAYLVLFAAFVLTVATVYVVSREQFARTVEDTSEQYTPLHLVFYRVPFDALPGWAVDDVGAALRPFLSSCAQLENRGDDEPFNGSEAFTTPALRGGAFAGRVSDWREICRQASLVENRAYAGETAQRSAIRSFFEANFTPVLIAERFAVSDADGASRLPPMDRAEGKATGYFEPVYPASKVRTQRFSAPVYARPRDLITVNLQQFDPTLAGKRIAGFLDEGQLRPYATRAEINAGAIRDKAAPLAYLDPTDLFFLQIQGSGRIRFSSAEGGDEVRLGYDGHNGRRYFAIGRALIDSGEIARENMSMQAIDRWLRDATPEAAKDLREQNPSFIFFRILNDLPDPELGPIGAQGLQLTAGRSLAVDRRYHGLGAPVFVVRDQSIVGSTSGPKKVGALMIAQDVGGAIKGPLRGDVYVGSGNGAGAVAGRMNDAALFYSFVPKSVAARYPELDRAVP